MAPKRKPKNAEDSAAAASRGTRRSARLANVAVAPPVGDPEPRKKKKAKTAAVVSAEEEVEADAAVSEEEEVEAAAAVSAEEESGTESPEEEKPETGAEPKTIVIEHCKQCTSFKTRAIQVKVGLEKGVDGVTVLVNPEKPRKGCFEIREEGGGIFVSLLGMKRPFNPMKDLDMEKVISDIIEKIG